MSWDLKKNLPRRLRFVGWKNWCNLFNWWGTQREFFRDSDLKKGISIWIYMDLCYELLGSLNQFWVAWDMGGIIVNGFLGKFVRKPFLGNQCQHLPCGLVRFKTLKMGPWVSLGLKPWCCWIFGAAMWFIAHADFLNRAARCSECQESS